MADLIATFPALPLTAYCTVVFEARDATTGTTVGGVKITNPVLYGIDLSPQPAGGGQNPPAVPLWLPTPDSSDEANE